jgi:plastocyanin
MRTRLTILFATAALIGAFFAVQALAATKTVKWHTGGKTTVKIGKGGTVKWVWTDKLAHNVKGPGFTSKVKVGKGSSVSHKFTKKGTFTFICQIHPGQMKTVVKVS